MQSMYKKIFWLSLFSIAMGYMETAVVVYLRKIYYPDGFQFPLVAIHHQLAASRAFFIFHLLFCYLGFVLLCFLESDLGLAGIFIYLGYFISYSCSLGRTGDCSLHHFTYHDSFYAHCNLLQRKKH